MKKVVLFIAIFTAVTASTLAQADTATNGKSTRKVEKPTIINNYYITKVEKKSETTATVAPQNIATTQPIPPISNYEWVSRQISNAPYPLFEGMALTFASFTATIWACANGIWAVGLVLLCIMVWRHRRALFKMEPAK